MRGSSARCPGSARSGTARLFCWSGRASEKDWDVLCRSTDGLVRCPFGGCMRRVQASCSKRASPTAYTFRPWSNRALTWVVVQAMRLVVAGSLRCSSNGSGRFETRPARAQEQPVRGVRPVFGVGQGLHGVTYRRDVPEPGVNTRRGGRPGQDGLGFLLLCAGGFRRVPVPGVAGRDPAHPGGPPLGRPFLHRSLGPLDHFSDDAHVDATGRRAGSLRSSSEPAHDCRNASST